MAASFATIWLAFGTKLEGKIMDNTLLSLTHEQQQQAVEQIQQLMQQGMSSGEAIAHVAEQLRHQYSTTNWEKTE